MTTSPLPAQRVLVTGASGFLGSRLCEHLVEAGVEVHGVSRTDCRVSHPKVRWHQVDLTDSQAAQQVFESVGADLVFHLCSYAQGERDLSMVMPTFRGEVVSAVYALTAATSAHCKRIVMAGSLEEPEVGEAASSPYAAAKAASRSYARMFHRVYGTPIVMSRIFMTYGPGQAAKKIIAHAITTLLRDQPLRIASPQRRVDWIYVEDVVRGLLALGVAPGLEGSSIDLGSGELVTIGDVVRRIEALVKPKIPVEYAAGPGRQDEQERRADVERTAAMTNWRPVVSLDDGLRLTVDFHARVMGRSSPNPT